LAAESPVIDGLAWLGPSAAPRDLRFFTRESDSGWIGVT
jgi:hypothetical protein